jgi:hypothetical protein
MNKKLVYKIVESLLDETTFLRAFKSGEISKRDIKTATAMRDEAGRIKGRKIPVISADMGRKYTSGTVSHGVHIYPPERWEDHKDKAHTDYGNGGRGETRSEKLRDKYYKLGVPHTVMNIDTFSQRKEMVPVLGHELGHMTDAKQDTWDERSKASEGFESLKSAGNYVQRMANQGKKVALKPTKAEKKTISFEGRAWRAGKSLHDTVVKDATPQEEKGWKDRAAESLRSYTFPYTGRTR